MKLTVGYEEQRGFTSVYYAWFYCNAVMLSYYITCSSVAILLIYFYSLCHHCLVHLMTQLPIQN